MPATSQVKVPRRRCYSSVFHTRDCHIVDESYIEITRAQADREDLTECAYCADKIEKASAHDMSHLNALKEAGRSD